MAKGGGCFEREERAHAIALIAAEKYINFNKLEYLKSLQAGEDMMIDDLIDVYKKAYEKAMIV